MAQACPNVSRPTIKRVLARLREEGSVECICLSVRVTNIPCLMCAIGYIGVCKAREDPVSSDVQRARISRCIHSRVV